MKSETRNVKRVGRSLERMVRHPSWNSILQDMCEMCRANPGMELTLAMEQKTEPKPQNPPPPPSRNRKPSQHQRRLNKQP